MKAPLLAVALGGMVGSAWAGGTLVVAGGGLPDDSPIYPRFVELATAAGGGAASICIFGVNSFDPADSTGFYAGIFSDLGAASVTEMAVTMQNSAWNTEPFFSGEDGAFHFDDPEAEVRTTATRLTEEAATVAQVEACTAFWFGGGNQNRGAFALLNEDGSDTAVMAAMRQIVAAGGVFGGTSAGAALQSDPMVVNGTSVDSLSVPQGPLAVGTDDGLGLLPAPYLIDQHLFEFGRFGRLYQVMADLDIALAAGVNNAAALEVDVDAGTWTVLGEDHALIMEREIGETTRQVIVHLLGAGDVYNVNTGEVSVNPELTDITGDPFEPQSPIYRLGLFNPGVIQEIITLAVDTIGETSGAGIDFIGAPGQSVFASSGVQITFSQTDDTQAFFCLRNCRADNPERSSIYAAYSVIDMLASIENVAVAVSAQPGGQVLPRYDFATGVMEIPAMEVVEGDEPLGTWGVYLERTGPAIDDFNFDVGGAVLIEE